MSRGPIFYLFARTAARRKLRAAGYSFRDINDAMDELDDDSIDAVAATMPAMAPLVGGPVLDAIIAFFQSEQGKALIEALVKMLIALISGL